MVICILLYFNDLSLTGLTNDTFGIGYGKISRDRSDAFIKLMSVSENMFYKMCCNFV